MKKNWIITLGILMIMHFGLWSNSLRAADIEAVLDDNAGVSAFSVKDSLSVEQAYIDSDGKMFMNGFQLGTSTTAGYVLTADPSGVGTWAGSSPVTVKALTADQTNATTTFAKVTNLDQVVGVGTWAFKYLIRYRSDTTTTGIKFAVNHTGTVTSFVANAWYQENTTAAATGAADQAHITFGLVAGGAARAKSTSVAMVQTASVDTINADMLMILEGLMVVTVSGNIELYHASEAATTTTVKQDSALILTKIL